MTNDNFSLGVKPAQFLMGIGLIGTATVTSAFVTLGDEVGAAQGVVRWDGLSVAAGVMTFVGIAVAFLAGAAFLFSSFLTVCASCRKPIETLTTTIPVDLIPVVEGRLKNHLSEQSVVFDDLPPADPKAETIGAIELEICQTCRGASRLTVVQLKWNGDRAGYDVTDLGHTFLRPGRLDSGLEKRFQLLQLKPTT